MKDLIDCTFDLFTAWSNNLYLALATYERTGVFMILKDFLLFNGNLKI